MTLSKSRLTRPAWLTATMWQTGLLFAIDMVTNVTDYTFHIYLGWTLTPGDFATVQTLNAVVLIMVTAFSVLQPVVARYVAQLRADAQLGQSHALFQRYFWQSALLGTSLMLFAWLIRKPVADWLNVPVTAVAVLTFMLLLALVRPVVFGMLQGQQRFVPFGLTRLAFAASRLGLALLLVGVLGGGVIAGIITMPLAALVALIVGLMFLGTSVWQRGPIVTQHTIWAGWRLSLAALCTYTTFMALQNIDLIWVNRTFASELAGSYATAVVLRRVLAVLPGAVLVVFYPRVVSLVAQKQLPDKLLLKAGALVSGITVLATAVYFILGPWIVDLAFGADYSNAGALLGWMGVGMIAYSLGAIWINLFLATHPWPFVIILGSITLLQIGLLSHFQSSLLQATTIFAACGWLLAISGLLLYLLWLRTRLQHDFAYHKEI